MAERRLYDGLAILRVWKDKDVTLFTHGFKSILDGRLNTKILIVGTTGMIVVGLPIGLPPPSSTAVDLTQAIFEMIEADEVPEDFWILPMGIDGYERFLSATCPQGAKAVFGYPAS
jgi:hypothetical protein